MEVNLRLIIVLLITCFSFFSQAQSDAELLNVIKETIKTSPKKAIQLIKKEVLNPELSDRTKLLLQVQLAHVLSYEGDYKQGIDVYQKV